jgi:RNA polymerase sigma-70 factor (ECF subfamily)
MLGSAAEAEDAVQEAWLRLSRSDTAEVENMRGWLTTVVSRICLDMLRARHARREELVDGWLPEPVLTVDMNTDPEQQAMIADSVGLALLVVLETLSPAERLAFVLHDLFDMPFEEIAPIVGRSVEAARQLASRARRRVRGGEAPDPTAERKRIIEAFLTASRGGDMTGLLSLLDPDVVLRADAVAARLGGQAELRGSASVAAFFSGRAQAAKAALLDGVVGVSVAPGGKLLVVMEVEIRDGRIAGIAAIADPERLQAMDVEAL